MDYFGALFQIYCYQSRSPHWKAYFQSSKLSMSAFMFPWIMNQSFRSKTSESELSILILEQVESHCITLTYLWIHMYKSWISLLHSIIKITNKKDCSSTVQKSGMLLSFCQDFSHFLCLLLMWASHCFIKQAVRGILFSLADFYHSSYCQTWQTGSWRYEPGIVGKNLGV